MESQATNQEARRARRKVHYANAQRQHKFISHPLIRFGGKYLVELGFNIGDDIEVCCEKGRILITKLMPDDAAEKTKAR